MDSLNRRALLLGLGGAGVMALAGCAKPAADAGASVDCKGDNALLRSLAALETKSGGKLGVGLLDCKHGTLVGRRLDKRFTMCSTFKLSLVAAVLAKMDAGEILADASLPISKGDPVGHSPVVRARLDAGEHSMTILDLCDAAQTQSDNGASNILLRKIGGPAALTAYWRSLGDMTSRLDRYEPELNASHGDDLRDTTTAAAMARSMRAMLVGNALQPASRERLIDWTIATQTGLKRLRGGLPTDWRAGDKTGTNPGDGSYAGKINDLAIVWHPKRAEPFIITAFLESPVKGADGIRPEDEAVLAQVGRLASQWIATKV
jgi:beta-lactamase class A